MFKMANKLSVMTNALRSAVSKQRIRYKDKGFNLDLAYICDNIIAMGVPADSIESIYRNRLEDVHKFLEEIHHDHYKVYNLCLERRYDKNKFHGRVAVYPFEDHNPPTIELIQNFCKDVDSWLKSDRQNVAAVHCKAGKGRTGTMICCYLVYSGEQTTAEEALAYYDVKRTTNGKGVTIPSQRRYVQYFAHLISSGLQYVRRRLQLCEIRFSEPNFLQNQKCAQCVVSVLKESEGSLTVESIKTLTVDFRKGDTLDLKNLALSVAGDIKIEYKIQQKKIFHFWFNTFFITEASEIECRGNENFYVYTLNKCEIDDAHKDTEHKCFAESFQVKLVFNTGQSEDLSQTKMMKNNSTLQENDVYTSENHNKVQNISSSGDFSYIYSHNPSPANFIVEKNTCDSSRINNKKINYDVVDKRLSFEDEDENRLHINNHLKDFVNIPSSRIIGAPETPPAYHHFNNISKDIQLNSKLLVETSQQTPTKVQNTTISETQSQVMSGGKQPITTIADCTRTAIHNVKQEVSLNSNSEANNATILPQSNHASSSSISSLCSSTVVVNDEDWESGSRSSNSIHLKKHLDQNVDKLRYSKTRGGVDHSSDLSLAAYTQQCHQFTRIKSNTTNFEDVNAAKLINAVAFVTASPEIESTPKEAKNDSSCLITNKSKFSTISSINFFGKRNFQCTMSGASEARTLSASTQKFKLKTRKNKKMLSHKFKWLKSSFRAGAENLKENFVEQTAVNCFISNKRNCVPVTMFPVASYTSLTANKHDQKQTLKRKDDSEAEAANIVVSNNTPMAEIDIPNDFYSSICDDQLSYNSPYKSAKSYIEINQDQVSVDTKTSGNDEHVVVVAANPAKNICIGFNAPLLPTATDGNFNLAPSKTKNINDLATTGTFGFTQMSAVLENLGENSNTCKHDVANNYEEKNRIEKSFKEGFADASSNLNSVNTYST